MSKLMSRAETLWTGQQIRELENTIRAQRAEIAGMNSLQKTKDLCVKQIISDLLSVIEITQQNQITPTKIFPEVITAKNYVERM